jgi:hypothetical protein
LWFSCRWLRSFRVQARQPGDDGDLMVGPQVSSAGSANEAEATYALLADGSTIRQLGPTPAVPIFIKVRPDDRA